MKHLLLTLTLLTSISFSQTDALNLDKYWKFRKDFVERFIKIGPLIGESLPAGSIKPGGCRDNLGTPNDTQYGSMHWGDGMIRHGFYLRLLASEYALKKKYGLDPTGTLNELYYALAAINRLDLNAEPSLDEVYSIEGFYTADLNGFYMREDVPEDFWQHWETDELNPRCTTSDFYSNNNILKVHDPANDFVVKPLPSHRNSPSLDQMTSLLVGLSLVNKLVDNIEVDPLSNGAGFHITDETKAIVDRMIQYVADHNWEIIDVNGWPSPNGGADLGLDAYPMFLAHQSITNNTPVLNQGYNRRTARLSPNFNTIQHCITGFGPQGGPELQNDMC